jgi:hypothetical protein
VGRSADAGLGAEGGVLGGHREAGALYPGEVIRCLLMAEKCSPNPASPEGFRIWRGPAPAPPLTQWAVDLRDHWMPKAAYGDTQILEYGGGLVLARKDHHTWTYKGGVLVTGICIPGITLYKPTAAATNSLSGLPGLGVAVVDTLETPDPSAAVYSVDVGTDWALVGACGAAIAAVTAAFLAGIKYAGSPVRR